MKIALIQSELVWGDVVANLDGFDKKIALCRDCDLILLPEMFTAGCMMVKKSPDLAQSSKDRIADYFEEVKEKMLAWATRQDALVVGSSVYREGKNYYNRLVAAFPDGIASIMTNAIVSGWEERMNIFLPVPVSWCLIIGE